MTSTTAGEDRDEIIEGNDHGSLHAAGFNAHRQLNSETTEDLRNFEVIRANAKNSRVLFAGWSTTVIIDKTRILSFGHQRIEQDLGLTAQELHSAIGDHDGLKACVDEAGSLYIVEGDSSGGYTLKCKSSDASPRIGRLALASNNRIAMTAKQAPNGNLCHLTEFETYESFVRWYEDPSGEDNYPVSHHMLPGRPKDLQSNIASFILLFNDGSVWTWGDSRYQSLGRRVTGDDATPAHQPGVVEDLGGLVIQSIAAGGWQAAAISKDKALYLWGATSPGNEDRIKSLEPGELSLVTIAEGPESEPLDVSNVSIGNNHIAAVADGRLYVAGQNSNGQLGLNRPDAFLADWHKVEQLTDVRQVTCGHASTFALTVEPLHSAEKS
ncbi:hypothetical protein CERZMDRAFT_112084 [Cercospora zeae-maydis SCOH1-5]|uniref:RCC1/BLIP-II protein n=1 Tax=Cercospora zeae-maydis SCOH1-5 TaxID=717836 RepID=A0A6A6FG19_9PEZI|nr:hypothetical protein CERZMDRAFT_112084 [Cercospora zeae-maydis SCOH1-5]